MNGRRLILVNRDTKLSRSIWTMGDTSKTRAHYIGGHGPSPPRRRSAFSITSPFPPFFVVPVALSPLDAYLAFRRGNESRDFSAAPGPHEGNILHE